MSREGLFVITGTIFVIAVATACVDYVYHGIWAKRRVETGAKQDASNVVGASEQQLLELLTRMEAKMDAVIERAPGAGDAHTGASRLAANKNAGAWSAAATAGCTSAGGEFDL